MTDYNNYAGQFLKSYEKQRYSFIERILPKSITVPSDAESFADCSFWQAVMDWAEYKKHARAVILRIGQNIWKDTEFESNYINAKAQGLAIGGYLFYDGRATPADQAKLVIDAMRGKNFEMEILIDWERDFGGAYEGLPNVVKVMQLIENAGVKCKAVGTYTGYYWFVENSNASTNAAQYTYLKQKPLWLAWFAAASVVRVPFPWSTWTHWQFGTPAVDWGQPTLEIDLNKHNGTKAEFEQRYLQGITDPEPPPTGETMDLEVNTAYLNGRASPNGAINFPAGAGLPTGFRDNDELQSPEFVLDPNGITKWYRITRCLRASLPVSIPATVWASDGGSAHYLITDATPPVEPPPTGIPKIEVLYNPAEVEIVLKPTEGA